MRGFKITIFGIIRVSLDVRSVPLLFFSNLNGVVS